MDDDKVLREELRALLRGGNAHMDFDDAVSGFPMDEINRKVPHGSYTVWHLLEHMRIVQRDILGFTTNPAHISPEFPIGYWPAHGERATAAAGTNRPTASAGTSVRSRNS
jgi:DNA-binding LytR/AlgR family response regulator